MSKITINNLTIDKILYNFVNEEVLPGTNIDPKNFWKKFDLVIPELAQNNKKLIVKREEIQKKIDQWHKSKIGKDFNKKDYIIFLKSIGYIVEEKENFKISTSGVDPEISSIAGPQLVVPVDNARYALNAANARWGSLYDALYGTDVIPGKKSKNYDPIRGKEVINYVRKLLESIAPLEEGKWYEVSKIKIEEKNLVLFNGEKKQYLKNKDQFIGFNGEKENPKSVLIKNNNLHIDIILDPDSIIGKEDRANISDVVIESAISTIIDNEDSVAAVDAEDKVKCYRNWLGLMKGDLQAEMEKNGKKFTRKLNSDRNYTGVNGLKFKLHGRALLLNRNVGHLMTSPAIILKDGSEIPEGIMDAFISTLCAVHDFKNKNNSRTNSLYIVKPKMHGPEEVAFTNDLFDAIEDAFGLYRHTIKVGIMDEERRTSVNLKECIRAAKGRVVFINTGFLDRTGDEIHTSMHAGPFALKGDLKALPWISAYEDQNVDVGLACGLKGKAQIGKGMWAIPDNMADMMKIKIAHPKSGANTAWVPSPTAATLHAMHYHQVDVASLQDQIASRTPANVDDILTIPLLGDRKLTTEQIQLELDNNAQGLLGYVVRWVEQGVGCSKVPDINNVGLMEDRATLRISSQHMANWLHHGICSQATVMETLTRMAAVVDGQNVDDAEYVSMGPDFANSIAFQAACDLVFKGGTQPSGYTEPLLHAYRQKAKAAS